MKVAPLKMFLRMSACVVMTLASSIALHGQSTYTRKLSAVVLDSSGAVIVGARTTPTDQITNVQTLATTYAKGVYFLAGLRPATYMIVVEAPNLAPVGKKDIVLAVSHDATLNYTLIPGSVTSSATVSERAPLLDTAVPTDASNLGSFGAVTADLNTPRHTPFGLRFEF